MGSFKLNIRFQDVTGSASRTRTLAIRATTQVKDVAGGILFDIREQEFTLAGGTGTTELNLPASGAGVLPGPDPDTGEARFGYVVTDNQGRTINVPAQPADAQVDLMAFTDVDGQPITPSITADVDALIDAVAALTQRVATLEAATPTGLVPDPDHAGYFTTAGLTPDPDHPDYYLTTGLTPDPDHPDFYLIGATA